MLNQKLTGQQAADKTYIEDVFSTYLYTGDGGLQSINNGIDLAGKGGMVWTKARSGTSATASHGIADTARGASQMLRTNLTNASVSSIDVYAFNSNGFDVVDTANKLSNGSGTAYASWTFRKAPKFFDVVTFTYDPAIGYPGKTISHNLGSTPGMVIVKSTTLGTGGGASWYVGHRATATPYIDTLFLSTTAAASAGNSNINAVTSTTFNFWGGGTEGVSETYVAYLFAHDTTTDGLIQCGSFTTDASGNATVNLGWEPQYFLFKKSSNVGNWTILDTMRGFDYSGNVPILSANNSNAETVTTAFGTPNATGVNIANAALASSTYIYMAIRRGPMRTPTDGTKVFKPSTANATGQITVTTDFPVDLTLSHYRQGLWGSFFDRLRGTTTASGKLLKSSATDAESTPTYAFGLDSNVSIIDNYTTSNIGYGADMVYWNFKRAPGFFDVVCYTGTGAARTVNHNLGVAPELMIFKSRTDTAYGWITWHSAIPITSYVRLNNGAIPGDLSAFPTWWLNSTYPTKSVISLGESSTPNDSGKNYVAYLFASCPGVSKVGSYTGNGSSQTINCGFSGGARFFLVKTTSTTGNWWVYDSARGIVSSTDPVLALNTTSAEVTSADAVDPDSTGIIVNQEATCSINANGVSYIYLAIA